MPLIRELHGDSPPKQAALTKDLGVRFVVLRIFEFDAPARSFGLFRRASIWIEQGDLVESQTSQTVKVCTK